MNNTLKTSINFKMGNYIYRGDLRYFDGILSITGIPIRKTPCNLAKRCIEAIKQDTTISSNELAKKVPVTVEYDIEIREKNLDEHPGSCFFDVYGVYIVSYDEDWFNSIFRYNPEWVKYEILERWYIK